VLAGIALAVSVGICLIGVRHNRAVVSIPAHAIPVCIVVRIVGTHVAGITRAVSIGIYLV
jgi:hypothetical protein